MDPGSRSVPNERWIQPAGHSRLPAVPAARLQSTDATSCCLHSAAGVHPLPPISRRGCSLSIIDLWRQVELHVAVVCPLKVILHEQGCIWPEAKLHSATERRRFGKVHEVAECKRRGHGLVHCEGHLLFRLLRLPRLEHHVTGANITLHAECDTLLTCLHLHRLAKLLQVSTNLLELSGGQLR